MKRPIILAKKEDKTHHPETSSGAYDTGSKSILDKPKILLKSKDKDHGIAAQQQLAPVQISIATRPTDTSGDAQKTSSQVPKNNSDSTHTKDPHHSVLLSSTDHLLHANSTIPVMKKSQPIITDHYQINSQTLDYLVETNTDFFVVGIIGALGSGKSTIMNILCESDGDVADENADQEELPWYSRNEIFKTRSNEYIFSNMVATEGIQMFIKRDRTILLDCSPVLCNPYKRDSILNEIDDLKMVIFLLNVCHLLIVVEEGGFNVNLLRLLQCAEKMKVDLYEKDYANSNSPNILFFKNYCENRDFLPESKELTNVLHKEFFKDSKLKIMAFPTQYGGNVKNLQQKGNVNIFYFPHIDGKSKLLFLFRNLCFKMVETYQDTD